ncbi:calcium-binding protein [Stenotrophomonas sp. ZAC14D2_NAIMI4_7]|uniref:calcium-binding protein n=1 Tax=Stenotrophomonas sp. ZAC14D2_NAIMI4_7 TaxID=2072405 RepID=UPI000D53DEE8|nr:calcium-binding protein [Stenotrophomonas sp. ZAC14D2_NAIMI4_7]AWH16178.1 calcium-binding protein [Stenotrophomonas sp. ZAC14D2_NAIMI4_7]
MHSIFRRTAALLLALGIAVTAHADDTAAQIRQHAADHRMLVLGEFHGTRETPLLVRQLVDDYSRTGPVVLALELPRGETPTLRDYLASDGGEQARRQLRGRAFWTVRYDQHDGRRSRDMLAMIESLRVLKAQGRVIDVVGYDVNASKGGNQIRDDRMAAELRRLYGRLPDGARMLVLTGNVHAMLQRPAGAPPEMQTQPMASLLRDLDVYSVRLGALRGQAWACADTCVARSLPEQVASGPRVDTHAGRQYDLWVWMPELSVGTLVDP